MSKAELRLLDRLGRERLSKHFYMRQFLYSEIGSAYGVPNVPVDPDLALEAGRRLATELLDPLVDTFGAVEIRSAYRSPTVNELGNKLGLNCGSNEWNRAHHIWDYRDKSGGIGATACVFIPWFTERYEAGRDWRDLAFWIHDHLPYSQLVFFSNRCAFNLNWRENPLRGIKSWIGGRGCPALVRRGAEPDEPIANRQARYADFPKLNERAEFKAQKL